jgi:hypothetical protein
MAFVVYAGPVMSGYPKEIGNAELRVESNQQVPPHHYTLFLRFVEERFGEQKRFEDQKYRAYEIRIEPSSFQHLAEGMIRADREAALKAFGAALQVDTTKQRSVWFPEQRAD